MQLHKAYITTADITARTLTKMLQVNNSLAHLNISQLTDSGAYLVFNGLQHNTTLVHLNLSNCDITAIDRHC